MERDTQDVRRAVAARDAASLRVRHATRISVALGIALTGVFAAVAAGSTHTKKIVVQRVRARTTTTAASRAPVVAPAPPIVGAGQSPSSSPGSAAPSQPQSAPAPSPAPASVPPTVVSGGS